MKNFIAVLLIIFLFSACKSGGGSGPVSGSIQNLFPLAIGNQWVYGVTEYRSDGTAKGTEYDTVRIVGSTTFQGNTAYQVTQPHTDTLLWYYSGSNVYTVQKGH